MTVTVIGNHSRGYLGHGIGGNGIANVPSMLGWAAVAASAADDVQIVQISSLINGDLGIGVYFQSEVEVTLDFTLCNAALATSTDPLDQASVLWSNTLTLPPSNIEASTVLFTAVRLTFSGPGTCYIGAR